MRPFHVLQVVTWVVFLFNLLHFYCVLLVSLRDEIEMVAASACLYGVLSVAVIALAAVTTALDPTDPTIYLTH